MVNSPSRTNVRPVAPPPLGGSVRPRLPLPPPGTRPAWGGNGPVPTILDAGPLAAGPDDSSQIQPNQSKSRSLRTATVLSRCARGSRLPLPLLERLRCQPFTLDVLILRAFNPQSAVKNREISSKNRKIKIYQETTTRRYHASRPGTPPSLIIRISVVRSPCGLPPARDPVTLTFGIQPLEFVQNPFKSPKIKIYQESTTQPVWNPATSNRHPARGSSICAFGLASRVGGFA